MNVFVYGTLMHPEVMRAITNRVHTPHGAVLTGYARYRVMGELYPGLTPEQDAETPGILFQGLTGAELRKLDAFEGSLYQRVRVAVRLEAGDSVEAQTYVIVPSCRYRLSDRPWSINAFGRQGLRQFIERYSGFRRVARGRMATSDEGTWLSLR